MSHPSGGYQDDSMYAPPSAQPPAYQPADGGIPAYNQLPAYPPPGGGQLVPYQAVYDSQAGYPGTPSVELVSAGGRFGGLLLETVLVIVTLWVGWLIWALFTWANGQTPAKQILGHVVVDAKTGEPFGWGRMLLREFVVKTVLGYLANACTFGIYTIVDGCMVFGDGQRTLHDRIVDSVVRYR